MGGGKGLVKCILGVSNNVPQNRDTGSDRNEKGEWMVNTGDLIMKGLVPCRGWSMLP